MNQFDQWNRKIRTIWYCSSLYMEYKNAVRQSKKMSIDKKTEYWEKKHEEFATKMLNNIYELKGWWVKVGQFLSTQENFMPSAYIEKFTNLQNMMPTSSYDKIEAILKKELGDLKEIFIYIDKKPLASASIGQVHRAKILKRNNSNTPEDDYNVIIKIQHEGIDHFLSSDIATLKKVSWAFGLIDKSFYFDDFINEWQNSAALELNYKYELYHQLLAYNTVKKSQIPLRIPKIYCAYTTTKVLVMEYINGFKITDLNMIKKYNIDKYKLVYSIIDYFAFQIHNDGFFHGDPHPGNILVLVNEKKNKKKKKKKKIENEIKEKRDYYNKKIEGKLKYESEGDVEHLKKNEFIKSLKLRSITEENKIIEETKKMEKKEKKEEMFRNGINENLLKSGIMDIYSFEDMSDENILKRRSIVHKECFSDDLDFIRNETEKIEKYNILSESVPTKIMVKKLSDDNIEKVKHKEDWLLDSYSSNTNEIMQKSKQKQKQKKTKNMLQNRFPFYRKLEKKKRKNKDKVKKRKYTCTPVIIDWGLIKQLDSIIQLAFCKLIYNVSCMNVLNIIEAFEDMGFCFKEDFTYDPEIYIENLKMFFLKKLQESSKTMESSKEQNDTNNISSGEKKGEGKGGAVGRKQSGNFDLLQNVNKNDVIDKNPVSDVPKDIIFFIRVASLLHGLCTQLDVKVNYLSIFAKRAKEALENIYTPISNSIYTIPIDKKPNSFVEKRIHTYLKKLYIQNKILGCQLAIIHKKKLVVNTCVGVTSNIDKRPITKHSLFNGYCLNKCVLTLALIHLITNAVNDQQSIENNNIYYNFEEFLRKEENKNKKKEKERERERKRNKGKESGGEENLFLSEQKIIRKSGCIGHMIMSHADTTLNNAMDRKYKKNENRRNSLFSENIQRHAATDISDSDFIHRNFDRISRSTLPNETQHMPLNKRDKKLMNPLDLLKRQETEEEKKERIQKRYAMHERLRKYIEKKQIKNFKMTINENICNYWDGFINNNKKNIRIKDLLTQKCFLEKPFHDKITLSKFIDYSKMINMIENCKNYKQNQKFGKHGKNEKHGKYLYLIYAYIVAELIHTMSGLKYNEYIYKYIVKPLHLKNEMFIPIPSIFLKKTEKEQEKNDVLAEKENVTNNEKISINTALKNEKIEKKTKNNEIKGGNIFQNTSVDNGMREKYLNVPSFSSKVNEDINNKKKSKNYFPVSGKQTTIDYSICQKVKGKQRSVSEELQENIMLHYSSHRNDETNNNRNNIYNDVSEIRNMSADRCPIEKEALEKQNFKQVLYKEENMNLHKLNGPFKEKKEGRKTSVNVFSHSNRELLYQYNVCEYINVKNNIARYSMESENGNKEITPKVTSNINANDTNSLRVEGENKEGSEGISSISYPTSVKKNKGNVNLKNAFLNHVDNMKEKTKRINNSIKSIYENNEKTFFKKIFLTHKRSNTKNDEDNMNCNSIEGKHKQNNDGKNEISDDFIGSKKKIHLRDFIRRKKKISNDSINKENPKNICNTTDDSLYESIEDIKESINKDLYSGYNIKERHVETNTKEYIKEDIKENIKWKEKKTRSASVCPSSLDYCINNNILLDQNFLISLKNKADKCINRKVLLDQYNIESCSCIQTNNISEYPTREDNEEKYNIYDFQTEKEKSFHKFMENDNIKTLFKNIDTKSSGEESVNSELEKRFKNYHKKSKKYKQFFQYLKDLKHGLNRNQRNSNIVAQKEIKKVEKHKNKEEKNNKMEDSLNYHDISDEELMKKLIEYKYFILNKQKLQTMEKKKKKNIYNNEHSDDIEMFSDTTDSEIDKGNNSSKNIYKTTIAKTNGLKKIINKNIKLNKNEQQLNEKKKQLEIYLIMNNLYKKKKKRLLSVENHTISKKTNILWRLAFGRRNINIVDSISKTGMTNKIENLKKNINLKVKVKESDKEKNNNKNNNNISSSNLKNEHENIIHDVKEIDKKIKLFAENFNVKTYNKYISIFQLAKVKPYILDPLIYDSKKILDKFIPINGRFTAKALCKLFAFMNNQFFFPKYVLNKIRKKYTQDESLESFFLTAGMSRIWGLGFQLFECEYDGEINEDFYLEARDIKKRKKEKKERKKKKKKKENDNIFSFTKNYNTNVEIKKKNKSRTIVGYGQSDISGCLALSFPEIDFSLTILLTDIFKGPQVSHLILEYILRIYGIKPKWKLPVHISEMIQIF